MERCRAMMTGQFFSRSNWAAVAINEYNEFFVLHSIGVSFVRYP